MFEPVVVSNKCLIRYSKQSDVVTQCTELINNSIWSPP